MKRIIFALVILLGSCASSGQIDQRVVTQSNDSTYWAIESRSVRLSSTSATLDKSLQRFNVGVDSCLISLGDSIAKDANELFATIGAGQRPGWKFELFATDTLYMATDRYVSLMLTAYEFRGGAHGQTQYYPFNFDVQASRWLTVSDILDTTKLAQINGAMQAHFDNASGCFSSKPTLEELSAINFSDTNVIFTFEHYILGPYSCGSTQVFVPVDELQGAIKIKL